MEETAARIEGTGGKVLFLPPVISVTFSTFPVSQESKESAPKKLKLSTWSDCSHLQTSDAKWLPLRQAHQRAVQLCAEPPDTPLLVDKDLDKGPAIMKTYKPKMKRPRHGCLDWVTVSFRQ